MNGGWYPIKPLFYVVQCSSLVEQGANTWVQNSQGTYAKNVGPPSISKTLSTEV